MDERLKLHQEYVDIMNRCIADGKDHSKQVYYQPKEGERLTYPCILYSRIPPWALFANDKKYVRRPKYLVTVIDYDQDSEIARAVEDMTYTVFDRIGIADRLYHFYYQKTN